MPEYISKEEYEHMEALKVQQDSYVAKIIEMNCKKIKALTEDNKKLYHELIKFEAKVNKLEYELKSLQENVTK